MDKNSQTCIQDYYLELKNKIAQIVEESEQNEKKKHEQKIQQEEFFNIIDKIYFDNLQSSTDGFFSGKFCFLIARKYKQNYFFGENYIGKLVITNQFIPETIISYLEDLSNFGKCFTCLRLQIPKKYLVIINLIMNFIELKDVNVDVIDISDKKKNILPKFVFKSHKARNLSHVDFDVMDAMVNVDLIEECEFSLTQIYELPDHFFFKFKLIKRLFIVSFFLSYEPSYFKDFENLEELKLYSIFLTEISKETLAPLEKIERLTISDTKLEKIHDGAFENMKSLKILDLSQNKIKQITSSTFSGLNNLIALDLSWNPIEKLSKDAFDHLKNLQNN
ncbi:leucine-rich repeat-containing 15 [Brachionus plicatilis]|uniref:Leucine-rich repeat-containing 15 n=1 Tax=Brachionus plicatilis TaxID=10195 RepID=A0A3M7Q741_BRAPC|nr:leucine-rich repeat-containing 15 [Brachionus plicatilis]